MSNIGENIRARRLELGLSQEELAYRMGYKSKSSINKIEIGVNDIPQSKVVQFAEALHTTPQVLMGWETIEKKNDTISDIVLRMTNDEEFRNAVTLLSKLDSDQLGSIMQMLKLLAK